MDDDAPWGRDSPILTRGVEESPCTQVTTNTNFLKVASFSFRSENPPPRQKELPSPFGLLMGQKGGKR